MMPLNFEPKESAKRNSYGCGWGKALRGVNGGSINQRFGVGIRKDCIKAPHPGIITGIILDAHGYWQYSDRSGIIPIIFPIYCDIEFSFQFCDIKNLAKFF
jgi:hypothetical protein